MDEDVEIADSPADATPTMADRRINVISKLFVS